MVSIAGKVSSHEMKVEDQSSRHLEAEQTKNHLQKQILKLDVKHQEVIRLKFQNEMSYKQIADVTGHSVTYVGVLLHEGIKSLRINMKTSSSGGNKND